jgi:ubiquinone/menaquinone biosynthesis C-methylase UbiE
MEPALQRRVQRYGWDKASAYYQDAWHSQLKPAHDTLFAMANICPGQKIIETACGTGLISFRALEAVGASGFVLATDISDKMVAMASGIAMKNKVANIRFERMDAEEIQADHDVFDVAICALGLMYVPNPLAALKEMYRVLKPGGRCTVAVWGKRGSCGWAEIFEIMDKKVSSEVCPMFFSLGNDSMLEKSFDAAGFSSIRTERISSVLRYESDEEACAAAFEGGPVALPYFKFPEEIKQTVRREYIDSISQFKKLADYEVPAEFVIGTGLK